MFHLYVKPRPPTYVGRLTDGHEVDSSATVMDPGCSACVSVLSCRTKSMASRFSRPPKRFGTHCPALPRVVEIQHRRDRVDPQPVGVVLVQPEQRVRQEEVADFVAPVVEDQRAPVAMLPLPWIGVLEERGAVEGRETVRVLWKMSGDPVEDDADARRMARVDERLELGRRAEAARRREEPDDLVAPRSGKGMLHHRQQLDVRVAHLLHVRDEPVRKLAVRQVAAALLGHAPPRSQMHLVHRHRPLEPRRPGAPAIASTPRRATRTAAR